MKAAVPSKRQLAEFVRFWKSEKGPYIRLARGKTEEQAKASLLAHYVWLWEGAGCPLRFIPKPLPHRPITFGSGRADTETHLPDFDQNILPNRDWTL